MRTPNLVNGQQRSRCWSCICWMPKRTKSMWCYGMHQLSRQIFIWFPFWKQREYKMKQRPTCFSYLLLEMHEDQVSKLHFMKVTGNRDANRVTGAWSKRLFYITYSNVKELLNYCFQQYNNATYLYSFYASLQENNTC